MTREEVIAAFRRCGLTGACGDRCPYNKEGQQCFQNMRHDVLEILKQQRQTPGRWVEFPACLQYEGAYSEDHVACSVCGHVFCTLDNCFEEFLYCPHCGARMDEEVKQE